MITKELIQLTDTTGKPVWVDAYEIAALTNKSTSRSETRMFLCGVEVSIMLSGTASENAKLINDALAESTRKAMAPPTGAIGG